MCAGGASRPVTGLTPRRTSQLALLLALLLLVLLFFLLLLLFLLLAPRVILLLLLLLMLMILLLLLLLPDYADEAQGGVTAPGISWTRRRRRLIVHIAEATPGFTPWQTRRRGR